MTRPDWASGPEWEGWEPIEYDWFMDEDEEPTDDPDGVRRTTSNGTVIRVAKFSGECWIVLDSPTKDASLRVANAIAAELGGWE